MIGLISRRMSGAKAIGHLNPHHQRKCLAKAAEPLQGDVGKPQAL